MTAVTCSTSATFHGGGGLNERALALLEGSTKDIRRSTHFWTGYKKETCMLNAYVLNDGTYARESVQIAFTGPGRPMHLLALVDESGQWIECSRWTPEEIEEERRKAESGSWL